MQKLLWVHLMEIKKSLEGIGSSHGGCLEFNTVQVTLTTKCSKVRL